MPLNNEYGYFIYSSGGGATGGDHPPRPPSLSLLPTGGDQRLHEATTGLLYRGERDLVVAELTDVFVEEEEDEPKEAEILVFRSGEWGNKRAVIILRHVGCESHFALRVTSDTLWKIMLDARSKTLLSVFRYDPSRKLQQPCWLPFPTKTYFPSKIFDYLIPDVTCINDSTKPAVIGDKPVTSAKRLKVSLEIASPEEILAALEEIPDLASDDLLKAYSILINDNGRRFRSLLVLPMCLRKKWLLIEIKNSEACSNCSACTDKHHVRDTKFVNCK
uniref:DUF1618 domain-containing protein n=1 Tax=Leersia perrieri TaxID=77586 RepID=A0A0D9XPK4_9ORYZ